MHSADTLAIHIQELEKTLLQSSARKSEVVSQLLSDEFVEFASSGRTYTKEQVIASLHAEPPANYSASDLNFKLLAPQTVLITYLACRHSEPLVFSLRSSIWQQCNGRWQILFHQGTISPAHK